MSRGNSGRIVIEIDPETKNQLYIALVKNKMTLKDWFLHKCTDFISDSEQPGLFAEVVSEKQPKGGIYE